jgi:hypothetical protein
LWHRTKKSALNSAMQQQQHTTDRFLSHDRQK